MGWTEEEQQEHTLVMSSICQSFLSNKLPMVLKGGTALKLCYGLNRFSEDLYFDSDKPLNLETTIKQVFTQLGKSRAHLRNPQITRKKDTETVRRYRIVYGDDKHLNLETSFRGTPADEELTEINGILTYKISVLIDQKIKALSGRTAARDLHDVIYLYEHYPNEFSEEAMLEIKDLYENQGAIISEYGPAFEEDNVLSTEDLLSAYMKFIDLYKKRNYFHTKIKQT